MPTITDTGPAGLVLSPKTARGPRFAGPEAVNAAAADIAAATLALPFGGIIGDEAARIGLGEGPRSFVVVSPGSIRFARCDLARGQRRNERELRKHATVVDEGVGRLLFSDALATLADGGFVDGPPASSYEAPIRQITSWSYKSRANMVRRLVSLDWTPLVGSGELAMVTLTYPGDWLTVAPSGAACLRHLRLLQLRWKRRWGSRLAGAWKREFQRRGAPHYHFVCAPPGGRGRGAEFRRWLSETWADIVAHPDPVQRMLHESAGTGVDWNEGLRMLDPKSVAVYFTKHGMLSAKEYQNQAPAEWRDSGDSIGRCWGVWGMHICEAPVMVSDEELQFAQRTMRRWHEAGIARPRRPDGTLEPTWLTVPVRVCVVWRVDTVTGQLRKRKVRRRIRRLRYRGGFISVPDGAHAGMMIARIVGNERAGITRNRPILP